MFITQKEKDYILERRKAVAEGWDDLPNGWTIDSVKKFWKSLTGDRKHKITKCMKQMEGKVSDPGAFCASLARKVGYDPTTASLNTSCLDVVLVINLNNKKYYYPVEKFNKIAKDFTKEQIEEATIGRLIGGRPMGEVVDDNKEALISILYG